MAQASSSSAAPPAYQEEAIHADAQILIDAYLSPPPAYTATPTHVDRSQFKPFCLPRISTKAGIPFVRGIPAGISTSGLSDEQWLNFVDGFNLAISHSAPLRVVDTVGKVIGFVPVFPSMTISATIQGIASTGLAAVSKTASDRYLRAANTNLFHPRGLSVRICTTRALRQLFDMIPEDNRSEARKNLDSVGRGIGRVAWHLPLPLVRTVVRALSDPVQRQDVPGDLTEQRLALFKDHIAYPVDRNVPPERAPETVIGRSTQFSINRDIHRADYKQRRLERRNRRSQRLGRSRRAQRRTQNHHFQVAQQTEKLQWLCVFPSEVDAQIQGIEIADSNENTDKVDQKDIKRAEEEDTSSSDEE